MGVGCLCFACAVLFTFTLDIFIDIFEASVKWCVGISRGGIEVNI